MTAQTLNFKISTHFDIFTEAPSTLLYLTKVLNART